MLRKKKKIKVFNHFIQREGEERSVQVHKNNIIEIKLALKNNIKITIQ